MTNLKLILFAISMLISTTAFPGDDKNNLKSLSKKVQSVLKTPEAVKKQHASQTVTVYFSVNENGDVIDVLVGTDNKEIRQDVESQFRCMNFKGLKPSVTNSIDVHFVVY